MRRIIKPDSDGYDGAKYDFASEKDARDRFYYYRNHIFPNKPLLV